MTRSSLQAAVQQALGKTVVSTRALHGGDLSEVLNLTLSDGCQAVAKMDPLVHLEGRMLTAMAETGAPVPKILGQVSGFLFLEALAETSASPLTWRDLGAGLRKLHQGSAPQYGWPNDYAFGSVAIPNTETTNWIAFWRDQRLFADTHALPAETRQRLARLADRLSEFMPAAPRPALLHGDLWTGNALFTSSGAYLIDPACYYGDPEVDIAMLHLFGTPDGAFWEGYGAPEIGWRDRIPLYQLWPALVHLRLFGRSYHSMVENRLSALGF